MEGDVGLGVGGVFLGEGEGGEEEECFEQVCEHSAYLLHVSLLLLPDIDDLPELLGSALSEDLDIAPAHGDPVAEETQLTVQPLCQTHDLPGLLLCHLPLVAGC